MKWKAILFAGFFLALLFAQAMTGKVQSSLEAQKLKTGKRVFVLNCQLCHGEKGSHPDPTFNLADGKWKHGGSRKAIEKSIMQGFSGTPMLGFKGRLSRSKIAAVAAYVASLSKRKPK